jgi:SAM-dependent methyltransferase
MSYARQNVLRFSEVYRSRRYVPKYPAEWIVRAHGIYLRKNTPSGRILDLGCGTGSNARLFVDFGYEVDLVDASEEALPLIQETVGSRGSFTLVDPDWTSLPFDTAAFDLVLASQVLYYLGDETRIRAACDELTRVLKPGGHVLISMIGPPNFYISQFGRPLEGRLFEIAFDPAYRMAGASEVVYVVPSKRDLLSLFDMFDAVTVGYFDHAMFDVTSSFHWIFIGQVRA